MMVATMPSKAPPAIRTGRSVYFSTLADIVASLVKAGRDGQLRDRIRVLARAALLVVDAIGYRSRRQSVLPAC
jgi:DNA replication protein DnaC